MEFGRFCIHILGMVTQVIMLCDMRAKNYVMWDMPILCRPPPPQLIVVSLTWWSKPAFLLLISVSSSLIQWDWGGVKLGFSTFCSCCMTCACSRKTSSHQSDRSGSEMWCGTPPIQVSFGSAVVPMPFFSSYVSPQPPSVKKRRAKSSSEESMLTAPKRLKVVYACTLFVTSRARIEYSV